MTALAGSPYAIAHAAGPEHTAVEATEPDPSDPSQSDGTEADKRYFDLSWERGLNYRLRSILRLPWQSGPIERLQGRFGVKLQVDGAAYAQSGGLGNTEPGLAARRVYLYTTGDFFLLTPISFKVQMGFLKGFDIDEVYLRLERIPYLRAVRVGHFTAPMSLDQLTSCTNTTFMERAAPVQAFVPGRKLGIEAAHAAWGQRLTWAFGWFTNGQREATTEATKDVSDLIGRVTWLPYDSGETVPNELIHVGASANWLLAQGTSVRFKSRPESFLAPILVDTGGIDAGGAFIFGAETATVSGPVSLQSEYFNAVVRGRNLGTLDFQGLYLSGSVFLTGERRPYERSNGAFGRVIPNGEFSLPHGRLGAWEWGARFSYLDLNDGPVRGGRMHVVSSNLSWYLTEYLRLQFEQGISFVNGPTSDGRLHTFQTRFQLAF